MARAVRHRERSVLGLLVAAGVLAFTSAVGIVFTTILESSLTEVVGAVSPVAFLVLAAAGALLVAVVEFGRLLPAVEPPGSRHPVASAFGYGFFFGAIVVPCNPGFIAVFFARAFLFADPIGSLLNFLAFGGGIAAPLVTLAAVSDRWRSRVMGTHRPPVARQPDDGRRHALVAVYYLVFVFEVVPT